MGKGGDARRCNVVEGGVGPARGEDRGAGDGEGWREAGHEQRGFPSCQVESRPCSSRECSCSITFVLLFRCGSVGRGNRELCYGPPHTAARRCSSLDPTDAW